MTELKRKLELDELSSKRLKIETETTQIMNDQINEIEEMKKKYEQLVKENQELKASNQEVKESNLKYENKLKEYDELEEILSFNKLKELVKENKELKDYKNKYISSKETLIKAFENSQDDKKIINSLRSLIKKYNNEYDSKSKYGDKEYPVESIGTTYNQYKSGYYRHLMIDRKLYKIHEKFREDFTKIDSNIYNKN